MKEGASSAPSASHERFTCVHVDLGKSFRAHRQVITKVAKWTKSRSSCRFVAGDLNAVATDEVRTHSDGQEIKAADPRSAQMKAELAGMVELFQSAPTFRRLASRPGETTTYPRIGRICASLHQGELDKYRR